MAKRRGFPPVYKIERVAKMSVKRAFFSVFQKIMVFCCVVFFGFANAFSANLPSGYTELEYLESTGTQYIDTGYKPKTGDKIRIVYQYNSLYGGDDGRDATSIFGCTDGASATTAYNGVARVVQGTSTINRIAWGNGTNSIIGNLTYNNATGVWYDLVCDNGVFTINDTQLGTTSANSFSANFSMYLFARNTGGTAGLITKGKIQIAQIWDNGTLVRNMVPAKNSSGVIGMYDTVNDVFYTNAGTGEFTAGPVVPENPIKIATTAYNTARFSPVKTDLNNAVATIREIVTNTINQTAAIASLQADKQTRPEDACPAGKKCLLVETEENGVVVPHWFPIIENIYGLPAGYTPLEYIQSDGNSWIDTGIKGNMSYKYDIEFQQLDAGQYRNWGAFNQQTYDGGPNMSLTYGDGFLVRWTVTGDKQQMVNRLSSLDTNRHHLVIDNGYVTWDGVAKGRSTGHRDNYQLNYNLFLGTINPGGTTPTSNAKSKYYSYKVWNGNGDLIQNFVPAKNSSGVIGMYDTVGNVFYTNAGTGTFTAGPEI